MSWPASLSLFVRERSSAEGAGSPLGWLWETMMAAADRRIAALKTSLGWTREAFRVPICTSSRESRACLASKCRQ